MIEEGRNCHCFVKTPGIQIFISSMLRPTKWGLLQGEFLIIAVSYTVVVPKPSINTCLYIINSPVFFFLVRRILFWRIQAFVSSSGQVLFSDKAFFLPQFRKCCIHQGLNVLKGTVRIVRQKITLLLHLFLYSFINKNNVSNTGLWSGCCYNRRGSFLPFCDYFFLCYLVAAVWILGVQAMNSLWLSLKTIL